MVGATLNCFSISRFEPALNCTETRFKFFKFGLRSLLDKSWNKGKLWQNLIWINYWMKRGWILWVGFIGLFPPIHYISGFEPPLPGSWVPNPSFRNCSAVRVSTSPQTRLNFFQFIQQCSKNKTWNWKLFAWSRSRLVLYQVNYVTSVEPSIKANCKYTTGILRIATVPFETFTWAIMWKI